MSVCDEMRRIFANLWRGALSRRAVTRHTHRTDRTRARALRPAFHFAVLRKGPRARMYAMQEFVVEEERDKRHVVRRERDHAEVVN